jgi:hypothetical protein
LEQLLEQVFYQKNACKLLIIIIILIYIYISVPTVPMILGNCGFLRVGDCIACPLP